MLVVNTLLVREGVRLPEKFIQFSVNLEATLVKALAGAALYALKIVLTEHHVSKSKAGAVPKKGVARVAVDKATSGETLTIAGAAPALAHLVPELVLVDDANGNPVLEPARKPLGLADDDLIPVENPDSEPDSEPNDMEEIRLYRGAFFAKKKKRDRPVTTGLSSKPKVPAKALAEVALALAQQQTTEKQREKNREWPRPDSKQELPEPKMVLTETGKIVAPRLTGIEPVINWEEEDWLLKRVKAEELAKRSKAGKTKK